MGAPRTVATGQERSSTQRRVQADAAWDASLSFLQLEYRDIVDAVVIYFADVGYSIGTSL